MKPTDLPRAAAAQPDSALQKVSRWKLPNTDTNNDAVANVAFVHEHRGSIIRGLKEAIGLIQVKRLTHS